MGQNIVDEVTFLGHSFVLGVVITFVYDGFLILRRLIKHNMLLISLEDMIFWIACAIGVFYQLFCGKGNFHDNRAGLPCDFLFPADFAGTCPVSGQKDGAFFCFFREKRKESREMRKKEVDGQIKIT